MYKLRVISESELDEELKKIDICLLTIPFGVRDQYIRRCADLGKAVYVEKPFAQTAEQHKEYCSLFPQHALAVGFNRRFFKLMYDIKCIIDFGYFGKLRSIRFNQGYFQIKGGSGYISNAKLAGGGIMMESAVHLMDMVLHFTNATGVKVKQVKTICRDGIDFDTWAQSELLLGDESIPVESHVTCLRNTDNGIWLEFENASLHIQPAPDGQLMVYKDGQQNSFLIDKLRRTEAKDVSYTVLGSFILFWKHFIASVRTTIPNKTNASSSLLTSEWTGEIYRHINNN
jgi:predicted dehydrogenase